MPECTETCCVEALYKNLHFIFTFTLHVTVLFLSTVTVVHVTALFVSTVTAVHVTALFAILNLVLPPRQLVTITQMTYLC